MNFPVEVGIVDDVRVFRQSLRGVLEKHPAIHVVAEAENGKEAVDLVDRHHPDVLVMDLSMPVMNGLDATRVILSRNPTAKILILTMYASEEMAAEALSAGACSFVSKDCGLNTLCKSILECAAGRA